jgi:hypothetical protein
MALWRDPLDELIAELERTLPSASPSVEIGWTSEMLVGCQLLVKAATRGTPDDIKRIEQDPRVRAYLAFLKRVRSDRRTTSPVRDTHDDSEAGKPEAARR